MSSEFSSLPQIDSRIKPPNEVNEKEFRSAYVKDKNKARFSLPLDQVISGMQGINSKSSTPNGA